MTYDHQLARNGAFVPPRPSWDPLDPYTLGRKAPTLPDNAPLVPIAHPVTADNVISLESVTIHMADYTATKNKAALMPVLMALSAITAQPIRDPRVYNHVGRVDGPGVTVVSTGRGARRYGVRPLVPCGGKVKLQGNEMATFIEMLVEVVMPRMRVYNGVRMPKKLEANLTTDTASWSGAVSLSLPREATQLFPQIEANQHQYPQLSPFQVTFQTSARGPGAADQARALLSGMRIPVRTEATRF